MSEPARSSPSVRRATGRDAMARGTGSGAVLSGVTPDGEDVQGAVLRYEDFRVRPHNCFACGELNDAGLHLKLHLRPDRCWTELTMTSRFEGWEGIVHGGITSTILDEIMGWSLVARDSWGVTARMSLQYKKPVLVGMTVRAEGWVTEAGRRLQKTAARLVDVATGVELATAEATYVAAPEARKRELKQRYGVLPAGAVEDTRHPEGVPSGKDGHTAGRGHTAANGQTGEKASGHGRETAE